jgi:hypothetical protein
LFFLSGWESVSTVYNCSTGKPLKKQVFARQKLWIASKTWQRLGYVYGWFFCAAISWSYSGPSSPNYLKSTVPFRESIEHISYFLRTCRST